MNKENLLIVVLISMVLILVIWNVATTFKVSKLQRKLAIFCRGKRVGDLESIIKQKFDEIDTIKSEMDDKQSQLDEIKRIGDRSYQKTSVVRYDAYEEIGGNLSFAVCMLDNKNDGFILNFINSREGRYSYLKEIVAGEANVKLTEEEEEVLYQTVEKE